MKNKYNKLMLQSLGYIDKDLDLMDIGDEEYDSLWKKYQADMGVELPDYTEADLIPKQPYDTAFRKYLVSEGVDISKSVGKTIGTSLDVVEKGSGMLQNILNPIGALSGFVTDKTFGLIGKGSKALKDITFEKLRKGFETEFPEYEGRYKAEPLEGIENIPEISEAEITPQTLIEALNSGDLAQQPVQMRQPETFEIPIPQQAIPGQPAVTSENMQVPIGDKFSSFVGNPAFIQFMAQMGKAIGGQGSVGQILGDAALQNQRSQIYDKAIRKVAAGEDIGDIPTQFLTPEQRLSLEQFGVQQAKATADVASTEHRIEKDVLSDLEQMEFTRETQLQYATISASYRKDPSVEKADDFYKTLYKMASDEYKAVAGAYEGTPQGAQIRQESLAKTYLKNLQTISADPIRARREAPNFFEMYNPADFKISVKGGFGKGSPYQVGDYVYTHQGIHRVRKEGIENVYLWSGK